MRINFSQLEEPTDQHQPLPFKFQNNLPSFWKTQDEERKAQQFVKDNQQINFTVEEPFKVSRSVSPENVQQQLTYLKTKNILPTSTVNFIQQELIKSMKSIDTPTLDKNEIQFETPDKKNHSIYFDYSNRQSKSKSKENQSPIHRCLPSPSPVKRKKQVKMLTIGERSKRRAEIKKQKMKKIAEERIIAQNSKEIQQVTLKPKLNYTMNSKTAKKVEKKRKNHFESHNISVFDCLYHDAELYTSKRQLQKARAEEYQLINHDKQKRKSKVHVFSTFQDRLIRSLENSAERKFTAQQKQFRDPETGRKMFVPDTQLSKTTYYTHFKSTCSINCFQQQKCQAKGDKYIKENTKINRSHEDITTTLNNSVEGMSQLTRKLEGKPESVSTIPGKRQEKLAHAYADLIWSDGTLNLSKISRAEERVLRPFLQGIGKFEYSASVSRQVFTTIFKDFIGRLNLFDKNILLQRLKKMGQPQKTSRTQLTAYFQRPKLKSSVIAPDHYDKFYYV